MVSFPLFWKHRCQERFPWQPPNSILNSTLQRILSLLEWPVPTESTPRRKILLPWSFTPSASHPTPSCPLHLHPCEDGRGRPTAGGHSRTPDAGPPLLPWCPFGTFNNFRWSEFLTMEPDELHNFWLCNLLHVYVCYVCVCTYMLCLYTMSMCIYWWNELYLSLFYLFHKVHY